MSKRNENGPMIVGIAAAVALTVVGAAGMWSITDSFKAGAIAHHEGRVAVTVLPDGSKVVTTVKENK